MPPIPKPLADSKFNLNSAGVAGFFGGDEATSAMATVHLYRGRRWLGWYNSPGSYIIAKRFGRMANNRFWDGLFPGSNDSPAITFGLDGQQGPKYCALLSGTEMQTGHLGYLTMEKSKETEWIEITGRVTTPAFVSYLAMKKVDYDTSVKPLPLMDALIAIFPIAFSVAACVLSALILDWYSFSLILLGIISSGLASYFIGAGELVLTSVRNPAKGSPPGHGVLMDGNEMVVIKGREADVNAITKGHFDLKTDSEAGGKEKVPGQGDKGKDLQQGKDSRSAQQTCREKDPQQGDKDTRSSQQTCEEKDPQQGDKDSGSSQQTCEEKDPQQGDKGSGSSQQTCEEKDPRQGDKEKNLPKRNKTKGAVRSYHAIGCCSLLLIVQFLLQLLLIPQASLFGQTMFLSSLGVSWAYNSYLSSLEKEKIQTKILFDKLDNPEMVRFRAGTWTTMTVFVCLLLFQGVSVSEEEGRLLREKALRSCLHNDTGVWKLWFKKVVEQLLHLPTEKPESFPSWKEYDEDKTLSESDRTLLETLLGDAKAAINGYYEHRNELVTDSSQE